MSDGGGVEQCGSHKLAAATVPNYHRMTHGVFSIGFVIGDRALRPFRTGSDVALAQGEAEIEPNCVLDGPPKNTRLRHGRR
jgi:hypothetical protein